MERLRQTHSKDMESKEDEVEDIRQSSSKKVRKLDVRADGPTLTVDVPHIAVEDVLPVFVFLGGKALLESSRYMYKYKYM